MQTCRQGCRLAPVFTSIVVLLAVFGGAGCSTAPSSRIFFSDGAVEGQPTQWIMDTGAANSWLGDKAATRAALARRPIPNLVVNDNGAFLLTPPARVSVHSNSFTMAVPVNPPTTGDAFDNAEAGIGWPEIRDNILVFDGAAHEVRVLDSVPEAAKGWTPLKVLSREQLFLEWPAADGKTIEVFVDTGSPSGVSLPTALWQAWKTAQSRPILHKKDIYVGADAAEVDYVWNAAVTLGTVKIEGVPVEEHKGFSARHSDFELGLYALSRMDLVVDAPAGVAYARPLPPSEAGRKPVYSPWTVDPQLRLNLRPLGAFVACMEGSIKQRDGDSEGAAADFSRAIGLKPDYAPAYSERAMARFNQEDFEGASSDLRRAIELDPRNSLAFFLRSLLWFRLGDIDSASADYQRAVDLDPRHEADYDEIRQGIEIARQQRIHIK